MRLILILFLFFPGLLLSNTWLGKDTKDLALFKNPVVNLYVGSALEENPPISYGDRNTLAMFKQYRRRCPSHQALFNEVVTVLTRKGSQVQIAFENLVYGFDSLTGSPLSSFWVDASHLIFLNDLSEDALLAVPTPGSCKAEEVVLVFPWNDYSVGTKFVLLEETDEVYQVKILDKNTYKTQDLAILKNLAYRKQEDLSLSEQKKLFVKTAYDLITFASKSGVIPYVLGGSSYVVSYEKDLFYEELGYFERVGPHHPYMGYDCAELIFRLAQMSAIPYLPKTTDTARKILSEVKGDLEEGDLIWFPGHMMIVSSLTKNEIIEARGYQSGYGDIHVLPLSECFEGVFTYEDLWQAYLEKRDLKLLTKEGSISSFIKEFCFLSLH